MSLIDELELERFNKDNLPDLLKDKRKVTDEEMAQALGQKLSTVKQNRKQTNAHKWSDTYHDYKPIPDTNEWEKSE